MRLLPDLVLTETGWRSDADGAIVAIEGRDAPRPGDVRLAGKGLLPGTVNAHCHTFQALLRGLGDDLDFMGWRDRVLHPFSERLDRRAIALGAQLAFAEQFTSTSPRGAWPISWPSTSGTRHCILPSICSGTWCMRCRRRR